jgi:hypothetical protein
MCTATVKIGRPTVSLRTGTVSIRDGKLRIDTDESMAPTAESFGLTYASPKVSSSSGRETAGSTNQRSGVRGKNHALGIAQPAVRKPQAEAAITNDAFRSKTRAFPKANVGAASVSDVSRALDASVPFLDGVVRIATATARVIGSASSPLTSASLILTAEFTRDGWAGAGVTARGPELRGGVPHGDPFLPGYHQVPRERCPVRRTSDPAARDASIEAREPEHLPRERDPWALGPDPSPRDASTILRTAKHEPPDGDRDPRDGNHDL